MQYKTILDAAFLSRPNRFIAKVLLDGKEEIVHVKNTGCCKELLLPGANVRLEVSDNPARKTKAGHQAFAGTGPGTAGRGVLRGGLCDPDGRGHRGAAQCGDPPGLWRGSGRGKGGGSESSLFALPGGQRFSGHCGPEGRMKKRCPGGQRMEYRQTEAVWMRLRLSVGIFYA